MKTILNEDVRRYLKDNYLKKTNTQMGLELGVDKTTIGNWREKIGLPRATNFKDFSKYKEYILKSHSRRTASSLAKEIGCSKSFVEKVWREEGLKKDSTFRYFCNEDFFKAIDNEKKAYWLGFIAADGCVYKREKHQGLIQISIKECDIELLEEFRKDIDSTHPINKQKQMVSVAITSQKMFEDLVEKGIVPKKTWCFDFEKIFDKVGKKFFPDFLRGYFDGDGCVSVKENIAKSSLSFAVPQKAGLQLQKILLQNYSLDLRFALDNRLGHYKEPFGNLCAISTPSKYILGKLLYPLPEKYGLQRKKNKILNLLIKIENNETNRLENITAVKKWEELLGTLKWQSAAEPDESNNSSQEGSTTNE